MARTASTSLACGGGVRTFERRSLRRACCSLVKSLALFLRPQAMVGEVEIEADGGVGLVAAGSTRRRCVACATEVLADVEEFAGADFLEGGFNEVEFGLRALDGTLVKEVPIRNRG